MLYPPSLLLLLFLSWAKWSKKVLKQLEEDVNIWNVFWRISRRIYFVWGWMELWQEWWWENNTPSRETTTEKHKGEQQEDTLSAQRAAPRAGFSGGVGIKAVWDEDGRRDRWWPGQRGPGSVADEFRFHSFSRQEPQGFLHRGVTLRILLERQFRSDSMCVYYLGLYSLGRTGYQAHGGEKDLGFRAPFEDTPLNLVLIWIIRPTKNTLALLLLNVGVCDHLA